MTQAFTDLGRRFRFNDQLLSVATEGFEEADWSRSPSAAGGNSAHWILGHLVASRRALLRKLGSDVASEDWEAAFGRDATPASSAGYPAPSELLADFRRSGAGIEESLAGLSDERGRAEWGSSFPDGSTTLDGGAHFLFAHEMYHLGQLGLLRRMTGKPGFA